MTGRPADVASVALHESNYDTNLAIQNILDGLYDMVEVSLQVLLKMYLGTKLFGVCSFCGLFFHFKG